MSHLTRLTSLSLEVGKSVNPSWILVGSSHVVHSMSNVVRNWMDDISRCWLMRSDLTRWEIHVQSWGQVDKASDMHQIRSLKVPRGANVIVQGRLVEDTTPGLFVLEALTHWSCVCVCVFPSFSSKIHKVAMLDWKALESSKCSDAVFVFICPAHRVVRGGWQIGSLEDRQVLARQGVSYIMLLQMARSTSLCLLPGIRQEQRVQIYQECATRWCDLESPADHSNHLITDFTWFHYIVDVWNINPLCFIWRWQNCLAIAWHRIMYQISLNFQDFQLSVWLRCLRFEQIHGKPVKPQRIILAQVKRQPFCAFG